MTSKKSDYQMRKDTVLGIVVNEYIKTVNPVSSGLIVQEYTLDLSSATIRNILAELEEEGFLAHPHTSAGRIPTQQGYRYYVDNLMNEIHLLEEEKFRIKSEYEENLKNLEQVMEKTSQVISDLTHYTSIISIDDRMFYRGTSYIVEYPENQDRERIRRILEALEEKKRILEIINSNIERKIKIYIGHEMAFSGVKVDGCSIAVCSFRSSKGPSGRIAILGPTRMNYQRVVSTLDYMSDLMGEVFNRGI